MSVRQTTPKNLVMSVPIRWAVLRGFVRSRQQDRCNYLIWLDWVFITHAVRAAVNFLAGVDTDIDVVGGYGHAAELSSGKDTPSGHWEIAGVPVLFDWGYFTGKTDTFPRELLDELIRRAELPGVLGNCHASGTTIIAELGGRTCRDRQADCLYVRRQRVSNRMP